jgi:hypothetical protein
MAVMFTNVLDKSKIQQTRMKLSIIFVAKELPLKRVVGSVVESTSLAHKSTIISSKLWLWKPKCMSEVQNGMRSEAGIALSSV